MKKHTEPQMPALGADAHAPLILSFTEINGSMLSLVGGKAANLGELTAAGLPVPPGFCLTTAAYTLASNSAQLDDVLDELSTTQPHDTVRLAKCAVQARERLLAVSISPLIEEAIREAYAHFASNKPIPMAVRSSATAEDLPFASFAGQQDTYLNITGIDNVLDAVRRCWSSLWTERAVNYRSSNGIDHRTVRLAVVVQKMIDAQVAGVLFTANPLSGRRHQAVIDASPGLGEAVVSGAVNPDHFVVNTTMGEIVERRLGDKRLMIRALPDGGTEHIEMTGLDNKPCLTDEQLLKLAKLGARVEAYYGSPQDTEWAIDSKGQIWLTQARPITTLFPLPEGAPGSEQNLRVYFSVNVAQGVYRPLTPIGIATFRLLGSSMATFFGFPPQNRLAGPAFLVVAAERLYIDATGGLRTTTGRNLIRGAMRFAEARSGVIFEQLSSDPRLTPRYVSRLAFVRHLIPIFIRERMLPRFLLALFRPSAARARIRNLQEQLRARCSISDEASAQERLDKFEQIFLEVMPIIFKSVLPVGLPGFALGALAGKLLGDQASADEKQTVLRGLPHNPTTQMDLELWQLACRIRKDTAIVQLILDTPGEELARAYQTKNLPTTLQRELGAFLKQYGHRGVAEIDLGLPRWSEDPTHILGVLANYLQLERPELAPDVQFQKGAHEAEEMIKELSRRAGKHGWLRGKLVSYCLRRQRGLVGLREIPKYYIILVMAQARQILLPVGEELVRRGRLTSADDIFFIDTIEARRALAGEDMHPLVEERRISYTSELKRRHIPRVLLSDGTEPEALLHSTTESGDGTLQGTPASAGTVTAKARVILDPTGARLEPGEILVAPSTDPGWTPLFLTAGGLVMEMGGPISHGAVVAREYGIPAVVGVASATNRIQTGQRITIDGSRGTILIEIEAEANEM
jgi:phosphohistidine swiveling domain-containing protein